MSSTTGPAALPSHPDARIEGAETPFSRFLRVDVVRFQHRLFSGEWSAERVYDVLRRGDAVALMLYDPDRDSVVLVEQFRLPASAGTEFRPKSAEKRRSGLPIAKLPGSRALD